MSFGDCMFSTPLTREVAAHNPDGTVPIITGPKYADAYINLPWISKITHDRQELSEYDIVDITPANHFWPHYRSKNGKFSLIDMQAELARTLGIQLLDQRPIFMPTEFESRIAQQYTSDKPLLAIESVYFSTQSWSNKATTHSIVNHYANTHNIIWLSNQDAIQHPAVDDCMRFSRRELITILNKCDLFYNVGSGFFCASLALDPGPTSTISIWNDKFNCEKRLAQLGWHNITWVHNQSELLKTFI